MDKLTVLPKAFANVAAEPPAISAADVQWAVHEQFGLEGEFQPLVSERDQNFRVRTPSGERYVVKVTSAAEPTVVSDFHLEGLLYLEAAGASGTPRVVRTVAGESAGRIECGRSTHVLRVVSYLEGTPLSEAAIDAGVASDLGTKLAALDTALQGFRHPGERPELLWDLQRVAELRTLARHIDSTAVGRSVASVIDDFESRVAPRLASLRRQVIHGDANPENVLLDESRRVCGFIDFSDSVNAPLVFDVAIAASYLRNDEPLALIAPFLAAYHAALPLRQDEVDVLFDLVRARLATTITILYWRLAERAAEDAYREKTLQTEGAAKHFLGALDAMGRDAFVSGISDEIGMS